MTSRADIIEALTTVARRAYRRGLQTGNGGNLSALLPGGERFVIKSSGASFAELSDDDLVEVDVETGAAISGRPSSELL